MKTSVEITDDILKELKEFNKENPERPINVSAVCRKALQQAIARAKEGRI